MSIAMRIHPRSCDACISCWEQVSCMAFLLLILRSPVYNNNVKDVKIIHFKRFSISFSI
nr:MAG TPA: hypothetical protein [Caudoviricetes sp.]DAX18504.1 MAG TPA: hypothetical protein [Caudoviricetes sp.]